MKVLNVFVLTVLCCSRGEGRIVSKCELREQLVKAIGNLTSGVSDDNLVATCKYCLLLRYQHRMIQSRLQQCWELWTDDLT